MAIAHRLPVEAQDRISQNQQNHYNNFRFSHREMEDQAMSEPTNQNIQDIKDLILAMDAKFEKKFDALDTKMDRQYAALDKKIDTKFLEMKVEITRVEEHLGGEIKRVEEHLGGEIKRVEERLGGEINQLEEKLGGEIKRVDARLDGIDKRLGTEEFISRSALVALVAGALTGLVKFLFYMPPNQ
jgi:exonuclease VII large subunit